MGRWMQINTLTIVGVGLIGGSIGLAAKRCGLANRILGTSRTQEGLDKATALGIIDEGVLDIEKAVRQAEMAVFCTPVDRIEEQVLNAGQGCSPETVLTDTGSTKAQIVKGVQGRLPQGVAFVGSHPLTGSEKQGPEYAHADLFKGKLTIVTQTPATAAEALKKVTAFWNELGSRVRVMDPEEHDKAVAVTSHFPHLVAAALTGILPSDLHELAASGFRDSTRIAAGDPALWTPILMLNRTTVLEALNEFGRNCGRYRKVLETRDWDGLHALLVEAKKVRDALGS
ncbi:MAG TPA: prephenate dehydrogenase/arogenate dehydrogenase family protein [Gemmataceae bacterium]|nr:prephenate dehydrogenase/arogenate dehydrogenase family protein [Gemmataceae bacterium]